jgi:hypothetical protein
LLKRRCDFKLELIEFRWLTRRGYVEGMSQGDI